MARSPRLQNRSNRRLFLLNLIIGPLEHYLNGRANNHPFPWISGSGACQAPPGRYGDLRKRSVELGSCRRGEFVSDGDYPPCLGRGLRE